MNALMILAGVLTSIVTFLGAVTIIFLVMFTDINEKLKQWLLHKIWW